MNQLISKLLILERPKAQSLPLSKGVPESKDFLQSSHWQASRYSTIWWHLKQLTPLRLYFYTFWGSYFYTVSLLKPKVYTFFRAPSKGVRITVFVTFARALGSPDYYYNYFSTKSEIPDPLSGGRNQRGLSYGHVSIIWYWRYLYLQVYLYRLL